MQMVYRILYAIDNRIKQSEESWAKQREFEVHYSSGKENINAV